jgi:predicted transcriptional regulator
MKPKKSTEERPIVQTVKLEPALFVRLKTFGAKTRRSNQDILHSALVEYLNNQSHQAHTIGGRTIRKGSRC